MSSSTKRFAVSCEQLFLFVLILVLPAATLLAADEEMVITGSRIPTGDKESINPITVLSSEQFKASGNVTVENFLQDLPQVFGGDFGSTVNNGNPGHATASLRGLGPNRTLVLINGHRPAPVGVDGFVDLNLIPGAIVDRIEVLRDGASTIYGSDAIAGVINVITKKDFEGVQFDAQWGQSDESDGEEINIAMTIGGASDRGNFVISAQYTDREEILQGDRGFSECAFGEDIVGGQIVRECIGSGTSYPANITPTLGPEAASGSSWIVDGSNGVTREFSNADTFNFATTSYMITPQEVYSVYGYGDYEIFDTGGFSTLNTSLTVNYSNRQSSQQMAPEGTFWGPFVPAAHPDNPFGDTLCASTADCSTPQDVIVARRLRETPGRGFTQDASSYQIIPGIDGLFSNGWSWDLSYSFGHYVDAMRDLDRGNEPRINMMLDPAACGADADCLAATTADGGPGYWNPFATDTLTTAMQDYALVDPNETWKSTLKVFEANLVGDMGGLELPGGPIGWSAGYQRRSEDSEVLPDGAALLGQVFNVAGEVTQGKYEVDELYGELKFPILQGAFLAEVLTVDASVRWSDYDFLSSSDTNWKFGGEWAPITSVRFRGTYSEGFRAPNIGELFQPVQQTAANYNEPCNNYPASGNQTLIDNCIADGLPATFSITSSQATGNEGGNPDLDPETSDSWNIGVVIAPDAIPTLSVTLDWFNIEIDNAIGSAGTDNIISGCYNSPTFPNDPLCDLIEGPTSVDRTPSTISPARRDFLNNIAGQKLTNENLGTFETSGLDFAVDYSLETGFGIWDFGLGGTYLDKYEFTPFPGAAPISMAGKFGIDPYQGDSSATFPEWKFNTRVGWTMDDWGVNWISRYIDETDDLNADAGNLVNTADSVWYQDLQGYYDFGDDFVLTIGAINLTDEDPPYVTNYDDMNTIHFSYDTQGRRYYARLSKKF